MNKIITIALTEYGNAIRSKAFIIGLLAMPLMMGLMIAVPQLTKDKVDLSDRTFAIVDYSGKLAEVMKEKAEDRNQFGVFDSSSPEQAKQTQPKFIPEIVESSSATWEEHVLQLSDRVRSKELFAFVLIESDVFGNQNGGRQIAYHTRTPTFQMLPSWLERVINDEVQSVRFQQEGLDQDLVREVTRRTRVDRLGLASRNETGKVESAKKENRIATFAIPAVSMFLLFMMVMSSAPALLNGVLEEKMQKIVEFLISSVTPFQLMMGKLLGAMLVSLTLSVLYLGSATYVAWDQGFLDLIPPHLFFWFFVFLILAILIFGSMFLAIGATCNEIQDAQSLMFPAMLMVMVPVMTWMPIIQSPTGSFARWMSLFPPATPMLMMLRMAVPPGLPLWEVLLGVVVAVGFTVLIVLAAGKIFRIGILSQGQTASFGRMVKWLLSK
ncbi:ABC transporter permease [bacterium]|jgi:ABC-2 type transport system permease protein|nr:ABC transporter permease [bacterium]MDA7680240.1 ABC transporter permease [bacterium]